jgi:hypothetical protein
VVLRLGIPVDHRVGPFCPDPLDVADLKAWGRSLAWQLLSFERVAGSHPPSQRLAPRGPPARRLNVGIVSPDRSVHDGTERATGGLAGRPRLGRPAAALAHRSHPAEYPLCLVPYACARGHPDRELRGAWCEVWGKKGLGKIAGPERNREMVEACDLHR